MKIHEILRQGTSYSFEFFPPQDRRDGAGARRARSASSSRSAPSFVSVTYGAGGTTRERTHELVVQIDHETDMTAMAHLTCAGHTRAELVEIVERYRDAGIENILALGGDPPKDLDLPPGELDHAIDLVRLVRGEGDFSIGVAAHPEPHPRSASLAADRRRTGREARARPTSRSRSSSSTRDHYFDLVDSLRELGVDKPVIPGSCRPPASPRSTDDRAPGLGVPGVARGQARRAWSDDPKAVRAVGIEEATKLCRELLDGGVARTALLSR